MQLNSSTASALFTPSVIKTLSYRVRKPQATTACFEEQYTCTTPVNHPESLTDRLLRKLCRHTNRLASSYTKRATGIRCEVVSVHTVDYVITRHTYCLPSKSL